MNKSYFLLLALFFSFQLSAQELMADVVINYSKVEGSNNQVFSTLKKSLKDFINTTRWTNINYKTHEKINCNFILIIDKKQGNNYSGSIQIQSNRPVFNSTYHTTVLNLMDTNFNFSYTEYEELIYNERKFSGKNLTDVIAYYVYLILGYDADTFKLEGGAPYFKSAEKIANNSIGQNYNGWSEKDGLRSRMTIINNVLNSDNNTLRKISYQYHINGLDQMSDNVLNAKNSIANSLLQLEYYQKGSFALFYPLDLFFQAKKDEIASIFSDGNVSTANIPKLTEILNSISPNSRETWNKLKK